MASSSLGNLNTQQRHHVECSMWGHCIDAMYKAC
jgi:hypothetical protein